MEFPLSMGSKLKAAIAILGASQMRVGEILAEVGRETGAFELAEEVEEGAVDLTIGADLQIDVPALPALTWNESSDPEALREAEWLVESAEKRREFLWRMGSQLASRQAAWLSGRAQQPLAISTAELATALSVQESTVKRLLEDKRVRHEQGEGALAELLGKSPDL